jgi:hypothetical protein
MNLDSHIMPTQSADFVFGSWVNVTENQRENRMYAIHLGSKHQLRHLQALFSSTRKRPVFDSLAFTNIWKTTKDPLLCFIQIILPKRLSKIYLLKVKCTGISHSNASIQNLGARVLSLIDLRLDLPLVLTQFDL